MPETDNSIKLYTRPNLSTTQAVHCWARDDSRLPSGLTRHKYTGETGMLPLLLHFPAATAQPQLCGVMSTVPRHSRVEVRRPRQSAALSFEYSTSLDI